MSIPSPAPGGGVYTGLDPWGRPSAVTYYSPPGSSAAVATYNVNDYYQEMDQNAHDKCIQRAINAAQASGNGGAIYIPAGIYNITTSLVVNADNITIFGDGWASQLSADPGLTGYMLIVQQPGGGIFRYNIKICDLYFEGNLVAAASGLDLQSTYYADLIHLRIRRFGGTCVLMDGSSGNTGAYNHIVDCTITDGLVCVQTNFSEWLSIIGGHIGYNKQVANSVGFKCGNLNCIVSGVQFDMVNTAIEFDFAGRNLVTGCQFDNVYTNAIYCNGPQNCVIMGNSFNQFKGTPSGQGAIKCVNGNSASNLVIGNTLKSGSTWPAFIQEDASTPAGGYLYTDNTLPAGTVLTLTHGVARGNLGYNPRGASVTQLAVPATATPLTNTTGADCTVIIATLGTLTAVAIGGTAITAAPAVGSSYRVPAGQTITLTYAGAAPTWQWFGD